MFAAPPPPPPPPPSMRRSQSVSPSRYCNMSGHSDPSCSHASALARSLLAIVTTNRTAKNEEEGDYRPEPPQFQLNRESTLLYSLDSPHSPFPSSAFSDYGSSECSSAAYTPSDSEDGDPFEFDNVSQEPSANFDRAAQPAQTNVEDAPPPPDNFRLFAAAIEMNSLSYQFALPSFPPKKLIERRPNRFGSGAVTHSAFVTATISEDPFAASFANALANSPAPLPPPSSQPEVPKPSSSFDHMDNTLAARRRRPDANTFRSNTFAGFQDSAPRTVPMLRRINTDDANLGRLSKSPTSIFASDDLDLLALPDTARSRVASSSSRPVSQILPLTPISPPSPEDTSTPPQTALHRPQQQPVHTADGEMSPPATPQMSKDGELEARKISMIPRCLADGGATTIPPWFGEDDDDANSFESNSYITALPPPALSTTASTASSTTIGGAGDFF